MRIQISSARAIGARDGVTTNQVVENEVDLVRCKELLDAVDWGDSVFVQITPNRIAGVSRGIEHDYLLELHLAYLRGLASR